jgi:OOP family OmpA-OmpF porin
MRRVVCFLLTLGIFTIAIGQDKDYIKPATLVLNYSLTDFKTASDIRATSLSEAINNRDFTLKNAWSGVGISYLQGITNNIDFVSNLNGSYVYYPFRTEGAHPNRTRHLLTTVDAGANIKLLSDKYAVVPYFNLGIGAYNYSGRFGAYIPLGVGFQFNVANKVFIFVNEQYRVPVTEEANYNFFSTLGVGIPVAKKKKEEPKPLPVVPQQEPVVVKPVVLDTDGDGIVDSLDKCPTVPGVAKYQGCPIPDTDKDGINDEEDRCPTVPGVARYQGCPIPDTDGDGVNDELDKCPTVPGPASNNGCPIKVVTEEMTKKVEMAAKEIYFETGKAVLLPKSFPKLDAVIAIMKENETVKMEIDGHTDNVGKPQSNQLLSENRAGAVVKYFASKGIAADRLVSKGFGATVPIDTNATPAGRAKNRRVEMKISD